MSTDMGQSRKFGAEFRLFNDVLIMADKAGFSEELWRRMAYEEGLMAELKEFVAQRVAPVVPVSLKVAREIMGRDKVISAHASAKAWGRKADSRFPIRYSEATLRECAQENATGKTDWRLIFCNGLSLREQRAIQGVAQEDGQNQPCFYNSDWWLKPEEDKWAKTSPEAGYCLVDVQGRFANKTWNHQNTLIADLGEQYERCDEHAFAEAIQTIFMVNKGERIAENWWHWGISAASDGSQVVVGGFARSGLHVSGRWSEHYRYDFRVAVSRKFDI